MMRGVLIAVACALTAGFAYWAYSINYQTQAALDELRRIEYRIAQEKSRIAILENEWAYLTRPERLRALVNINFDSLQLIQTGTENYGQIDDIPLRPPPVSELSNSGVDPSDLIVDDLDVEQP